MELQKLIVSFFFLFSPLITGLQVVQGSSHHHHHHHQHQHGFRPTKLFVFGDSYADTGNNRKTQASSWKVPYGMTYPGKPSGRYSDGGVLTDFMAKYLGIKSPLPFRSTWRKFGGKRLRCGMNFAFGGTGVFKTAVLDPTMTRQLDLFEMLIKKSLYTKRDLQCSLALVTLSGNDYSYLLSQKNVSNDDVLNFIPKVVNQLELNLKRVHGMGVKRVAVAALQPLGCLPRVTMGTSYKECDGLDNFAVGLHNDYLTEAVERLNNQTKDSPFVILDLYDSFYTIIQNKTDNTGTMKFETPLKPCCMGVSNETYCGDHDEKGVKQYTVCDNPKSTFFWDTAHPTHAGWHAVFSTLLATQQIF